MLAVMADHEAPSSEYKKSWCRSVKVCIVCPKPFTKLLFLTSHQTRPSKIRFPYLGWTCIIIKVLSIIVTAGDLPVPLYERISLFVPLFSFEALQRVAWMWESWTSLDLKTSRRTRSNSCALTSQMSKSSFISTSTYLLLNRWVFSHRKQVLIVFTYT